MELDAKSLNDLPPLVYSLLPSPSGIRILDLYPGGSHEHIRRKLLIVDFDVEWRLVRCALLLQGDPIAVECDGQKVWITTTSLHSASQRIRGITFPATMWIDVLCTCLRVDTLCINQSSKPDALRERQHQV
jgi:hypothetical protein